jgi:hypothetical protein
MALLAGDMPAEAHALLCNGFTHILQLLENL